MLFLEKCKSNLHQKSILGLIQITWFSKFCSHSMILCIFKIFLWDSRCHQTFQHFWAYDKQLLYVYRIWNNLCTAKTNYLHPKLCKRRYKVMRKWDIGRLIIISENQSQRFFHCTSQGWSKAQWHYIIIGECFVTYMMSWIT